MAMFIVTMITFGLITAVFIAGCMAIKGSKLEDYLTRPTTSDLRKYARCKEYYESILGDEDNE